MVKGIAHTAYTVGNMEASLAFYCEGLGFKKAFEINSDDDKPWIVYIEVSPSQFIELFYPVENMKQFLRSDAVCGYSHLCLEVSDIRTFAEALKTKGIKLDTEVSKGKDGNYQCWTSDPDGNRIEFMEYGENSLQRNYHA